MLRIIAICSLLSLGGCITAGSITDVVKRAQEIAALTCGFLPTVSTVTNILAAGNPVIATATQVADAICAEVAKPRAVAGASRAPRAPRVNGVRVYGKFVR